MIRKILKWIGIVLGSLIGLLVLAFVVLYTIGTFQWNKLHGKYDVPVETISIPPDQASIARGEHIAITRMCGDCHMDNMSGQSDSAPGLITVSIPNLTAGAGGVGATNADEDWVRAIRHGVRAVPRAQVCTVRVLGKGDPARLKFPDLHHARGEERGAVDGIAQLVGQYRTPARLALGEPA